MKNAYQRGEMGQIDYQTEALRTLSSQFHIDMSGTQPRGNGPGERRVTPSMLHAAIGMAGEAWELHFSTDPANDREEVGDIYWFCAVMAEELGTSFQEAIAAHRVSLADTRDPFEMVYRDVSDMLDMTKRCVYYGKPFERERFVTQLGRLLGALAHVCNRRLKTSPGVVMRLNLEKLRTRFPEKFTTSAALNRDLAAEREILERQRADQIAYHRDRQEGREIQMIEPSYSPTIASYMELIKETIKPGSDN